ncbi:MAG: hypothetical protein ABSA02_04000 [Trebonia sp.]
MRTRGPAGERAIGIDDFFLLPGETPEREHPLEHGELIYAIEVPATPVARRSVYLKFRDRESYGPSRPSASPRSCMTARPSRACTGWSAATR